jgi:hypothetical protein
MYINKRGRYLTLVGLSLVVFVAVLFAQISQTIVCSDFPDECSRGLF